MDYKKEEIKQHLEDYIEDQFEYIKEDKYWKDDLHHYAFNQDYYIIGTYQAKEWLGDRVFDVIEHIKEYENNNFGEVSTDFSDPERVVNMYTYIIGEEVVHEYLENYEEEEEEEEEEDEEDKTSISPFSKTFLKDTFTTSTES